MGRLLCVSLSRSLSLCSSLSISISLYPSLYLSIPLSLYPSLYLSILSLSLYPSLSLSLLLCRSPSLIPSLLLHSKHALGHFSKQALLQPLSAKFLTTSIKTARYLMAATNSSNISGSTSQILHQAYVGKAQADGL